MAATVAVAFFALCCLSMAHHMVGPKRKRWHDFTWEAAVAFGLASIITGLTYALIV